MNDGTQGALTAEQTDLCAEAEMKCRELSFYAVVYELRASEIKKWMRIQDVFTFAVAPTLLSLVLVRDVKNVRVVVFALSTLCSLAAWAWALFSKLFGWEQQLQASDEASIRARTLTGEMRRAFVRLRTAQNAHEATVAADDVKRLIGEHGHIYSLLQSAKVTTTPDMHVVGQQKTVRLIGGKCAACGQPWKEGESILDDPEAVAKFRKHHAEDFERRTRCDKCFQSRTP